MLFPALDMQIRQYNFEDMRKREYEIWTCVWRKTLSLDMHFVIYPKRNVHREGEMREWGRGESMAACGGRKRVSGATAGGWYKGLDADKV